MDSSNGVKGIPLEPGLNVTYYKRIEKTLRFVLDFRNGVTTVS